MYEYCREGLEVQRIDPRERTRLRLERTALAKKAGNDEGFIEAIRCVRPLHSIF